MRQARSDLALVPKLSNTIACLQKEHACPRSVHYGEGCEQYRNSILQQLEDAKDLQAAAKAETEGLRHLAKAHAGLTNERGIDVERIKELIQERDYYRTEADELLEIKAANPASQTLGFSDVASLFISPITPQDNNAEIAEYEHQLHAAEVKIEALISENYELSSHYAKFEAQVPCPASEPGLTLTDKSPLAFSDLRTVSISSRTPDSASTPSTNPTLLTELEDLGKSIMSLSTVPPSKGVIKPSTELQATSLLSNIALTINIQPTDKRKYSLMQRVQSVISATSSLDIHGPKEVVKQFVASMHDVETDHAEKSKLAIQLDKTAKQYRADIENLEALLQDKRKCLDPTHRMLADELEAKNMQFAMQEQLLASWKSETCK